MAWFITGLRHEAIRLAKKHKRLREHELLILNDLISQDAEDEVTEMLDTIATTNDVLLEVEDSVFLQEALSLLTPQQQKVITATVLEGRPENEAAIRFGMSQPAVHQMKERALNKLKKHFVLDKPTGK
ncbi:RNA polymerase sigma factor SigB [Pelotomaculum sp. FP]|uniref:sigma-70 family RNA polymerase sigma factor n=1 Tax=Pelotomaculum sp. FP TaxID=261474 RepID=UPI0010656497|nr:sigma-70 family RNA polymerase sigma factor [Pelotomaculum sp. FP]TEB15575.1 RNA polymerase sigma factor SigB [Pelotomaculum sp. FP]